MRTKQPSQSKTSFTAATDPNDGRSIQRKPSKPKRSRTDRRARTGSLPRVVERPDLVGVERDGLAVLVAVVGGAGSGADREEGDRERDREEAAAGRLLRHAAFAGDAARRRSTSGLFAARLRRAERTDEL